MKTIEITKHAKQRANQRGISIEQIELCISFGERMNRTGMEFFCMTKKGLKRLKKNTGAYMDEASKPYCNGSSGRRWSPCSSYCL